MKAKGFLVLLLMSITGVLHASDTLRIGYTEAPPFIYTEKGRLQGINVWLWNKLASENQWDYQIQAMPFDSLLLRLEKGEIDISLNPLTLTSERVERFDFTQPFFAAHSAIATVEQGAFKKILSFISSFLNLNFLKGLFVLITIISIFGFLGWYFERRANPQHFRKGWRGIWDGIWWSAVTLTTVGYGDKAPGTRWGKLSALVLMFGGMLFISGLTASIATSLTVEQLAGTPSGLTHYKSKAIGAIHNSSTATFLKDRLFKEIHEFPEVGAGLEELKAGKIVAFMHDEPILKYRIANTEVGREVQVLPFKFDPQFYGFGMAKGRDALRREISRGILEVRESRAWQIVLNEYGLSSD